ncbi:MAG: hypothetical protein WDW36_006608 [Sanguina aurantia]
MHSPASTSSSPLLNGCSPRSKKGSVAKKGALTLLPLAAIIFFEVSGGPFGTEDAVRAAGPLLTIIGFVVFPLLWSIPEALITAELATAFPENSGYVAWVTAAFGPFWGFQEGLWSWISGVCDNALYPVMLAANLALFIPQLESGWQRMPFLVGLSLFLSYLNYRGLSVVGHAVITSTILVLAPFIVLCILAIPYIQPSNYLEMPPLKSVDWGMYLNVMFWNLNYWDSVSTLAGEVDNPGRTFPRAMLLGVFLVVTSYLLPLLAALGTDANVGGDWRLGYFGKVAEQVGGKWLALWVMVAAASSQVGQYQAEMASDSYQVQGMAERGFIPKVLGIRSRHGTPVLGIILSSLGVLTLSSMEFTQIVTLLNAIYCLAELLEFAAFVSLRVYQPKLLRPYRVPLPTWAMVLVLTPATLLLFAVLALPIINRNWVVVWWTAATIVLGFVMYPLLQLAKRQGVRLPSRARVSPGLPGAVSDGGGRHTAAVQGVRLAAAEACMARGGGEKGGWCEFESLHFDVDHIIEPEEQDPLLRGGSADGGDPAAAPNRRRSHSLHVDDANGISHSTRTSTDDHHRHSHSHHHHHHHAPPHDSKNPLLPDLIPPGGGEGSGEGQEGEGGDVFASGSPHASLLHKEGSSSMHRHASGGGDPANPGGRRASSESEPLITYAQFMTGEVGHAFAPQESCSGSESGSGSDPEEGRAGSPRHRRSRSARPTSTPAVAAAAARQRSEELAQEQGVDSWGVLLCGALAAAAVQAGTPQPAGAAAGPSQRLEGVGEEAEASSAV